MRKDKTFLCLTGLCWLWISILVIGIDRGSKIWALQDLSLYQSLHVLPFFNFTLAFNKGAAFSFLHQANGWQTLFFCSLAFAVCLVIFVWLYHSKSYEYLSNFALCLIMGGALGNVWDRLVFGHVIDFFDFHLGEWHFAIFNVADSAICIGAFLLLLNWIMTAKKS